MDFFRQYVHSISLFVMVYEISTSDETVRGVGGAGCGGVNGKRG